MCTPSEGDISRSLDINATGRGREVSLGALPAARRAARRPSPVARRKRGNARAPRQHYRDLSYTPYRVIQVNLQLFIRMLKLFLTI